MSVIYLLRGTVGTENLVAFSADFGVPRNVIARLADEVFDIFHVHLFFFRFRSIEALGYDYHVLIELRKFVLALLEKSEVHFGKVFLFY